MSMEGMPSNERKEAPKKVSQEEVVTMLLENGFEDPDAQAQFKQWREDQMQKVESGETTLMRFNIAWAEIYRDAGNIESAIEAYEDCIDLAYGERNLALIPALEEEIARLRSEQEPT